MTNRERLKMRIRRNREKLVALEKELKEKDLEVIKQILSREVTSQKAKDFLALLKKDYEDGMDPTFIADALRINY